VSAPLRGDSAIRWTEDGQDYLHYLGGPVKNPTANPVQQVHRWRSADLTTERVISIGSGVQDLSCTLPWDGNPDSLVRLIAAGRRGATLEVFSSLANPSLSFPCVLVEAGDIGPDPQFWHARRHQVDVRLRRIDGGSWQALLEAPLFYWKAGQAQGLTFTRSGAVGEGVDSDGLLNLYAADVLRTRWLDLDGDFVMDTPSTPIEASRTNVYDFSDTLSDASWTKQRTSVSQNASLASPRGVASAASGVFALTEDTQTGQHYLEQTLPALTDDAPQSTSFWVRASSRSRCYIQTISKANRSDLTWFNLSAGAVGTTDVNHLHALIRPGPLAGALRWYRVTVVWDAESGGTTPRAFLGIATADGVSSYTGDGSSQFFVWNPQFEVDAPSPSSDIVTTSATNVTRADETLYAPFGHRQQRLTAYVRMIERGSAFTSSGVTGGLLHIGGSGSGADPRFSIHSNGGSDGLYTGLYDNASASAAASIAGGNAVSLDDEVEVLVHLDASEDGDGDVAISQAVGGGAATTPVLAAGPSGGLKAGVAWNLDPARVYLGSRGAGDRGYNDLRDVKVMPGVLSLAAMRGL
jgi:hypothetical protein